MNTRNIIYLFIAVSLTGLLVWGNGFLRYKFEASGKIGGFLDLLYGKSALLSRIRILEKENAELKIDRLVSLISLPDTIKVYSSYPENNFRELIIAGGTEQNIKIGDTATYGDKIFIGEVISTVDTWSVLRTIFDQNEVIRVRIGEKEADGLLKGGSTPTITLIPKKVEIAIGNIVLSADPKFRYGLQIGTIKEIIENSADQFKSATIEPIIQFSDIRNVSIRH